MFELLTPRLTLARLANLDDLSALLGLGAPPPAAGAGMEGMPMAMPQQMAIKSATDRHNVSASLRRMEHRLAKALVEQ